MDNLGTAGLPRDAIVRTLESEQPAGYVGMYDSRGRLPRIASGGLCRIAA